MNGKQKSLLSANDQFKFYSGDCYIFQYTYSGDEKDEYIVGTWFGKRSTEVSFSVFVKKVSYYTAKLFSICMCNFCNHIRQYKKHIIEQFGK